MRSIIYHMSDWEFAQSDPAQHLAKVHLFSMMKRQESGEVEFTISVKEDRKSVV